MAEGEIDYADCLLRLIASPLRRAARLAPDYVDLPGAQPGDALILVGETKGHLGASLYARVILGLDGPEAGSPPPVDLEVEKRNAAFVRKLIHEGLVNAVHDVSDGGVACAAAEMALASGVGFDLDIDAGFFAVTGNPPAGAELVSLMFGEDQGRYVIAAPEASLDRIEAAASQAGVPVSINRCAGSCNTDQTISLYDDASDRGVFDLPLSTLRAAHEGWLPRYMRGEA